jgi:hypothetical protein
MGECRMWSDVSSGFGLAESDGETRWRNNVEAGPADRRMGYCGWNWRDVIADCFVGKYVNKHSFPMQRVE